MEILYVRKHTGIFFRLVDCLLQYPSSDLAHELLGAFFLNLTQVHTTKLISTDFAATTCVDLEDLQEDNVNKSANGRDEDIKIKICMDRYRNFLKVFDVICVCK
jgi:hypothetical protein